VRRWPFKLYVCDRGHVADSTLWNVCWQCFPGGQGPATQQVVEVVPLSEVKEALQDRFRAAAVHDDASPLMIMAAEEWLNDALTDLLPSDSEGQR
jgi:hypothetical protein